MDPDWILILPLVIIVGLTATFAVLEADIRKEQRRGRR